MRAFWDYDCAFHVEEDARVAPHCAELFASAGEAGDEVGPAWQDVAKRYANDADARTQLIEKVSKGGKGNWTAVVGTAAMPPYSPRVSNENIAKLVDYVLSLADE